ncbi:hypothetical protein D1007_62085 [Hordeum vulgare]|nr:hypothetical protein D1007_62085 [Hordeum vulgare]
MAPTGKQRPEGHGLAPASPLLDCTLSKDVDPLPVLPWTVAESSEHGGTLIWPGAVEVRPAAVYPFFIQRIYSRLVPPFSQFFSDVLDHYGIQALRLQPNSILLLSVFSFSCEAFVGLQPLVALLRHFFSMRLHDDAHLSACISFVAAQSGNMLLKARKKVENFRHRWILMCLMDANPRLEEPKRLAPLQAHSRPLWEYRAGDNELRLRSRDLSSMDLSRVFAIFLGGDPGDLPETLGLLYHHDNRTDLVAPMPVFNERGQLPAEGSGPVEVSSGDTSGEGGLEKTVDNRAVSVPLPS